MLTTVFMLLNAFIVLFVAGTLMFSHFRPETFKKLIYLSVSLIVLPVAAVAIANTMGASEYWISDLIFMRGGNAGVPVTFGYGMGLGLMLNKLRRLIKGEKNSAEEPAGE